MTLCCLLSCYLSALLRWVWDCANHISALPAAPWWVGRGWGKRARLRTSDRKERLVSKRHFGPSVGSSSSAWLITSFFVPPYFQNRPHLAPSELRAPAQWHPPPPLKGLNPTLPFAPSSPRDVGCFLITQSQETVLSTKFSL